MMYDNKAHWIWYKESQKSVYVEKASPHTGHRNITWQIQPDLKPKQMFSLWPTESKQVQRYTRVSQTDMW